MSRDNKKPTSLLTHLVAGGSAGFMEACTCHPLDTVKVRMQLSRNHGVIIIVVNPTAERLFMLCIYTYRPRNSASLVLVPRL